MSSPLPEGMEGRSFLALDFETTGLDHRRDRVVEIGALRFSLRAAESAARHGAGRGPTCLVASEEAALSALVSPGMRMPAAAFAIHGISDEDLAGAPPFAALAPALLSLCEGAVLVAHNAPFDLSFLSSELERAGMDVPAQASLDTRRVAKAAFPRAASFSLGSLAALLRIEPGRAHRALDDARTCMRLLEACAASEAGAAAIRAAGAATSAATRGRPPFGVAHA